MVRQRNSSEDLKEAKQQDLRRRNDQANRLIENWKNSEKLVGEDVVGRSAGYASRLEEMAHTNLKKAQTWATLLENTKRAHGSEFLKEAQASSSFTGITPNHVMKVISYSYPNSVRGDIFHEWAADTFKDSYYFVTRQYGLTKRGATINTNIINTHNDGRPSSEIERLEATEPTNGATQTFTRTLTPTPIVVRTVLVFVDNVPVARDNGSGTLIEISQATGYVTTGTIDYTTGAVSVTLVTAPAATEEVWFQFNFDSEDSDNFDETMEVKLGLREEQFNMRAYPLLLSWNRMTTYSLGSTLDIDVEQQFITAAGEEIKKSADSRALDLGYKYAKKYTAVEFDANFASAGADDPASYADSFIRTLKSVEKSFYTAQNKGAVNCLYAGADIVGFLMQSRKWVSNESAIQIGPYLAGTYNGIPVYQAQGTTNLPNDQAVAIYKSTADEADAFLSFGVFLPMAMTQKLEYATFETEMGAASFEDVKYLNPYGRLIQFNNLDIL